MLICSLFKFTLFYDKCNKSINNRQHNVKRTETIILVNNPLLFTPLSLSDVALFDEEIVDFSCLVDVDLDQRSGLRQPQPALPPALVQ